ncbi:MAG: ATP-binding cassette domain-containing protein [Niameybacter sp.]|uniref:ATP-binding cassette domain-containing protein n=2 Tax=Niameybacter sp. TaxID=2033640 RepID=UPI002FC96AB4
MCLSGEILGLTGIVGAGRTELATTLFGKDLVKSGKVYLDGQDITGLTTKAVMKKGLNYVTEDRFLNGIFTISDVAANTTAACVMGGISLKGGVGSVIGATIMAFISSILVFIGISSDYNSYH